MRHPLMILLLCGILLACPPSVPLLAAYQEPRSTLSNVAANFTVIVLPDTQVYSAYFPLIYLRQTLWIATHRAELNIVYVAHEGDVVNKHNNTLQYRVASLAMRLLENPIATHTPDGIPYSILPGNHDHPTDNYNRYFGPQRYITKNYYAGHYGQTNDDSYILFTASGMDFIAVSLGYDPSPDELAWTDTILQQHAGRRALIVTHDLLALNASWDPAGQRIYDTVKDNPNVFLMLCGHNHGETQRTDTYQDTTIISLLADYQDYDCGGQGYLRILQFNPQENQIQISTYSPVLNQFETDANSQFTISYMMTPK